MAPTLGITVDLCMADKYHAHVDDLDLDARSQWVDKGNKSAFNYFDN